MSDTEAVGRRDRKERAAGLDTPRSRTGPRLRLRPNVDPESFGRGAESFARFMGTARFLVYMTAFVTVWLLWNTLAPAEAQFDPRALNYTLLTLILSLQASYAAPLILLAQNRQDDRDRVQNAQDRVATDRALADTEFLTREVADLKIALREVATRDFLRSELRSLLEELLERGEEPGEDEGTPRDRPRDKQRKGKDKRDKQRADGRQDGREDGRADGKGRQGPLDQPLGVAPGARAEHRAPADQRARADQRPRADQRARADQRPRADQRDDRTVTGDPGRPHPQGLQTGP